MAPKRFRMILIPFVLVLIPISSWAWSGKVVKVADGDSITVLRNKTQVKIRPYGIDCPERGQAFGKKAKQFTSKMVYGKVVEVEVMDTDRYGRTVALVAVNKQILNEELLKAGYAWVYYQYCHEIICHAWPITNLPPRWTNGDYGLTLIPFRLGSLGERGGSEALREARKTPLLLVPPDGLAGVYCGESVLRRCCLSDGRGNPYAATTTLILVTVFCAC